MDKDKDPQVALKASQILGQSKNKAYSVRALFFALRGPDEAASIEAVKNLAQSKEPSAVPELAAAARGNRQPVALAAIDALVALEQPAELEKLFSDGKLDKERQLRASSGALKLKDEKVKFGALTHQASQAPAPDALKALEGLAGVKDPDPRPSIEGALSHPEAPVRHDAAKRLAKLKNPASLKALSDAGTKPEDVEVIQTAASEIMGGLPVADILTYTGNKNLILQRVAYLALGLKADTNNPKIFETLKKGTTSSDAGIRASSVLALPAFKDDKAKEAILALGKDADPQVRRNVARALASWPAGTGTELLLGYLSDASGDVTQAAIETLEAQGEGTAYTPILKLFRGKPTHAGTRGACLKALVKLAPEKELQTVISTVGGGLFDEDRGVKILAIDLLGRYDNPASVTTLAALINDPVEEYRVRSILAMGNTGSNDAVELLVSVLNDQSKPVRLATMQSLGKLGKKSAAPAIEKRIAVEEDAEVVEAGKAALKGLK
jgi:HEAT repeat protein